MNSIILRRNGTGPTNVNVIGPTRYSYIGTRYTQSFLIVINPDGEFTKRFDSSSLLVIFHRPRGCVRTYVRPPAVVRASLFVHGSQGDVLQFVLVPIIRDTGTCH